MRKDNKDDIANSADPLTIDDVRTHVNTVLKDFYQTQQQLAADIDPSYQRLWQAAEELTFAGGKRLRPYLCVLAYQAFGGKDLADIWDVAVAQELLHLGLLVHDDIMDRDYIRHGVENVAGQYRRHYKNIPNPADTDHFANGAALLVGDLLLTHAYSMVSETALPPAKRQAVIKQLQQSMFIVTAGQLLDTEATLTLSTDTDPIKIARHKTAYYSFVGPLISGALVAGGKHENLTYLSDFGTNLGIAFQLADDILGIFGRQDVTGKSDVSDIEEGKQTLLMQTAIRKADPETKEYLQKIFGAGHVSQHDAENVREIMRSSGALAEVQSVADDYKAHALEALADLPFSPAYMQAFQDIADRSVQRTH